MSAKTDDQYWIDLIWQCRTSGLTDRQWCLENHIPASTFYYHIRCLRNKACHIPEASVPAVQEHQEVVPLELSSDVEDVDSSVSVPAIRLGMRGVSIEICNHARPDVIRNILQALQALC